MALFEFPISSNSIPFELLDNEESPDFRVEAGRAEFYFRSRSILRPTTAISRFDFSPSAWELIACKVTTSEVTSNLLSTDETCLADSNAVPLTGNEAEWVWRNYDKLRSRFGGQWIVVYKDSVVAHDVSLNKLTAVLDTKGIEDPYLEWLPPLEKEITYIVV